MDIGKVDEPLILVTNTFLAVEADPLNTATDELIDWSVVVSDALKAVVEPPPNKFLASEAEPDNAATEALIA